jgi:hypothetical protein
MALPKLNTAPKYELTVPSTGEKVRFRPFLVKEQKILLIAYESKDRKNIIQSILDTIDSCVEELDVKKLTTFDVDFIFTNIRAKSVGEKITVNMNCKSCSTPNEIEIDLDEIKYENLNLDMMVKINEDISIKMKYPQYDYFLQNQDFFENKSGADTLILLVASCMESVMTEEEQFNIGDESIEEVDAFINSLSAEQFAKIQGFIEKLPKLTKEVKFSCENCGKENVNVLQGLDDFF